MRKVTALFCTMLLLMGCFICHTQAEETPDVLIAYFSLAENAGSAENVDASSSASIVLDGESKIGTTAYVAALIQQSFGGETYAIQTVKPYPSEFQAVVDQNHQEAAEDLLPELQYSVLDLTDYDTVFIGYPVWASGIPQAVRAFLTSNDFAGKTIVPFCTHDGYGSGGSFGEIAALCPQSTILEGYAVPAEEITTAVAQVPEWLDRLRLAAASTQAETQITVQFGDAVLNGVLYDTPEARQFMDMLPVTVSMWQFGGREFYGDIDGDIIPESEGQLFFADGDITYCDQNNTVAIFYAQTDRPNLTMQVIPMGRVTSDLNVLIAMNEDAEMTFALAE